MGDTGSKNSVESNKNDSLNENNSEKVNNHPWGIFFTVLGTVLLDFDADACQSPARAYLLDITVTGVLKDLQETHTEAYNLTIAISNHQNPRHA